MKDDDLLRALAEVARRDPDVGRSPRWERLASGEATEEERARLATMATEEGEPEAMPAMAPMEDAVAARVMARLSAAKAEPEPKRNVVRFPRAALVAGSIAIAAGVALVAGNWGRHDEALPAYAMIATGGLRESRGAPPNADVPMRLGRDSQLSLVLRPARDVTAPLDARAAIVRAGHVEPWSPPISISPTGVVTIAGPAATIVPGPGGPCELVVVVGARGAVPPDDASIANAASTSKLAVGRAQVDLVDR